MIALKNKILDTPEDRYCEIYKIVNLTNGKMYVGQAVSHILNHKKYRPYGCEKRFKCHVSEAFSTKKNQSHYLNSAIRKYGSDNFVVELLEYCNIHESDQREIHYISELNSLYPHGYNLKNGGNEYTHTDESKKRVSNGVRQYYKNKKYERFRNVVHISDDIEQYIKPLSKYNAQYGWYVYIDGIKADFGGVHVSLDESKYEAIEFINNLRISLAKPLVAGNPLESITTTS